MNNWKEAKDANGRVYYYHTETKQSTWDKPRELEQVIPPVQTGSDWKSAKTKDGKVYYYNIKTKESSWTLPSESKVVTKTDSPNQSIQQKQQKQQQQQQQQLEQDLQKEEKPVVQAKNEVEKPYINQSKLLNIPVKNEEEAEKDFMQMLKENQVDSTWSFSKIISVIGTKDPRYWIIDSDPLWKQNMFEKYLSNRTETQLLKEHGEVNKFQDAFWDMLRSKESSIKYYTNWATAKRLILEEPIYKHSVVSEQVKKESFYDYVTKLKEEHESKERLLKEQAVTELRDYLNSILMTQDNYIPMTWQHLQNNYLFDKNKRYMANKHFAILTHEDVLIEYINIINVFKERYNKEIRELQDQNYTHDRFARDKFKELISSNPKIIIRANSKWSDIYNLLKDNLIFLDLIGRNGSNAIDLFMDVVEERHTTISGQRSIAQQLLIDQGFQWTSDETSDKSKITQILQGDSKFPKLDIEDIQIIIEQIVKIKKEKEVERMQIAKYKQQQRENFFRNMLHQYYKNGRIVPGTWVDSRRFFQDTIEYKELGDNVQLMEEIFNKVKDEIIQVSDHGREAIPSVAQGKKRQLESVMELDY